MNFLITNHCLKSGFTILIIILLLIDYSALKKMDHYAIIPEQIDVIKIENIENDKFILEHMYRSKKRIGLNNPNVKLVYSESLTSDNTEKTLISLSDNNVEISEVTNDEIVDDRKDYYNYCEKRSSIIVPKQYELMQSIIYSDLYDEENSEEHRKAMLRVNKYVLINDFFAEQLLDSLIESRTFYNYEESSHKDFSEFWIEKDRKFVSFIARKDNVIHRVFYRGEVSQEKILKEISKSN